MYMLICTLENESGGYRMGSAGMQMVTTQDMGREERGGGINFTYIEITHVHWLCISSVSALYKLSGVTMLPRTVEQP